MMKKKHVLFIHDDGEVPKILEKELSNIPSWVVSFESFGKSSKQRDLNHFDLLILQTKNGWLDDFQQIQISQSTGHAFPIMVLPLAFLKKNVRRFLEMAQVLLVDSEQRARFPLRQTGRSIPNDPLLQDFVERKLKEFVKKMKASQSRNLYNLLLKEIEKPLITLSLKETRGNQIQAASLLGMNRNTLRKKIKELKISLKHN